MIKALDHLDLVVTSLERSQPFSTRLFGLSAGERDRRRARREGRLHLAAGRGAGRGLIGLRGEALDAHPTPYDRYGVGVHHVAFEVDRARSWTSGRRGCGRRAPRSRAALRRYDYREGYYALFFYDPDGFKLELMYVP